MKLLRCFFVSVCLGTVFAAEPNAPAKPTVWALLASGKAQAVLTDLAAKPGGPWPGPGRGVRYGASRRIAADLVAAAVAAHALDPAKAAEWSRRLYGEKNEGRRAFHLVLELLDGDYTHILDFGQASDVILRATGHSAPWHAVAVELRRAAGNDPKRQAWRNTAAGLEMLALAFSNLKQSEMQAVIAGFASAPLDVRKAIAEAVVATPNPKRKSPGGGPRSRLWRRLQGVLSSRNLKEPVLATLVLRLAPKTLPPAALSGLIGQVATVSPAAGEEAADLALDRAPNDPRTIIQAAIVFKNAGKEEKAYDLLRTAEKRLKYPARRDIRLRLFSMLRGPVAGPVSPSNRRMDILNRYPDLQAEVARRRKEGKGVSAAELKMIEGDAYSIARDMRRAARLYREAYTIAKDPALKQAALSALGRTDPRAAWKLRKQTAGTGASAGEQGVAEVKSGTTGEPVTDESFGTTLAAGIAGRKIDDALDWAVAELEKGAAAKLSPRFAGTVAGVLVGTGRIGSASDVFEPPKEDAEFAGFSAGMFGVAGRPRYVRLCRNSGLVARSSRPLAARLDPVPVWLDAVKRLTARIPTMSRGSVMGGACMFAFNNTPTESPEGGGKNAPVVHGDAARAKTVKAAETLVAAALAWVEKHPKDRFAPDRLTSAAASALRRPQGLLFVPACNRLFLGCMARASGAGVDPGTGRLWVRRYLNALATAGASDETVRELRTALAKAWPGASFSR